jgi:hypothetical protein
MSPSRLASQEEQHQSPPKSDSGEDDEDGDATLVKVDSEVCDSQGEDPEPPEEPAICREFEGEIVLSAEDRAEIEEQMAKHVQLLATSYIFSGCAPCLEGVRESATAMLVSREVVLFCPI